MQSPYLLKFCAVLFLFLSQTIAVQGESGLPNAALDAPLIEGGRIAFFGITFIDTSTEGAYNGVREDETARVELLEKRVVERLEEEGFEFVDITPVLDQVNAIRNPADCNYCDVRMARELGADYALTGEVQKVSNLILSMNLVLRDAKEGQMQRGLSVDFRSNTDESWLQALRYIFKYHYFPEEEES